MLCLLISHSPRSSPFSAQPARNVGRQPTNGRQAQLRLHLQAPFRPDTHRPLSCLILILILFNCWAACLCRPGEGLQPRFASSLGVFSAQLTQLPCCSAFPVSDHPFPSPPQASARCSGNSPSLNQRRSTRVQPGLSAAQRNSACNRYSKMGNAWLGPLSFSSFIPFVPSARPVVQYGGYRRAPLPPLPLSPQAFVLGRVTCGSTRPCRRQENTKPSLPDSKCCVSQCSQEKRLEIFHRPLTLQYPDLGVYLAFQIIQALLYCLWPSRYFSSACILFCCFLPTTTTSACISPHPSIPIQPALQQSSTRNEPSTQATSARGFNLSFMESSTFASFSD